MTRPLLAIGIFFLTSFPAGAAGFAAEISEPGRREFAAGDFPAARDVGRGDGSGEGLAIACHAGLVLASYLETGEAAVSSLHGAILDCAEAIGRGDVRADTFIGYAIGIGFEAKRLSSRRLGVSSRRLMEAATARFPGSGFAYAALGGWHSSVSEEGLLTQAVLGASRNEARKQFAQSLRLESENFAVNYEYLRFLAYGDRKERAEGSLLAARLLGELTPSDRYEELLRGRAAIIAAALREGGAKPMARALQETEPFPGARGLRAPTRFEAPFLDGFPD